MFHAIVARGVFSSSAMSEDDTNDQQKRDLLHAEHVVFMRDQAGRRQTYLIEMFPSFQVSKATFK